MITIFNRKELVSTLNMKRQAKIREVLEQHHIDYDIKTVNRKSPSPAAAGSRSRGTYGENLACEYEYTIFVKKDEFEKAKSLIQNAR